MSQLTIALLGAPQIEVDHKPIEVDTRKATALLAYLAVSGAVQSRDTLAALALPIPAGRANRLMHNQHEGRADESGWRPV